MEVVAQLANDPERNLLVGGVASVTLSAREAEARQDKQRQVSRRYMSPVFGAAVELRGIGEWVVHADVEHAKVSVIDGVVTVSAPCKPEAEPVSITVGTTPVEAKEEESDSGRESTSRPRGRGRACAPTAHS